MSKDEKKVKPLETYSAGLKRRAAEEKEVKVVQKPRKMNLVKPKRIPSKTQDFANSALLVFPTDSLGITTALKAALIRAGSKIGKDEAGLELIKQVVEIGMKHIEARFAQNVDTPVLKRRVDTSAVEDEAVEEVAENGEEPAGEVSYGDMVTFLAEKQVKPKSRKKADVEAAYNELTKYEQDEEDEGAE